MENIKNVNQEISEINKEIEDINNRKSSYVELSDFRKVIKDACTNVSNTFLGALIGLSAVIFFKNGMVNAVPTIIHTLSEAVVGCACIALAGNIISIVKTGFSFSGLRIIIDAYEQSLSEDEKRMNELLIKKNEIVKEEEELSNKSLENKKEQEIELNNDIEESKLLISDFYSNLDDISEEKDNELKDGYVKVVKKSLATAGSTAAFLGIYYGVGILSSNLRPLVSHDLALEIVPRLLSVPFVALPAVKSLDLLSQIDINHQYSADIKDINALQDKLAEAYSLIDNNREIKGFELSENVKDNGNSVRKRVLTNKDGGNKN